MVAWEKIGMVQKMQDSLEKHLNQKDFDLDQLYLEMGYSKRHCERVFKEMMGQTIKEYIKKIRLSDSSKELLQTQDNVLDIALKTDFETHEGYTRAFQRYFHILPNEYRKRPKPIPLFIPYPIRSYYYYLSKKEELKMKKETTLCMTTVVEKPERKLIFLRSQKATDYFTFCEEKDCQWEGLLNSIPEKMDTAAILELPKKFKKEGFSMIAAGVEVPCSYQGEIPEGYEMITLEPCQMLYFETEPFQTEEEFFPLMESVLQAVEVYQPKKYGMDHNDEVAPRFNFGGEFGRGARYAIPVKRI